jgi:hypothetical protein
MFEYAKNDLIKLSSIIYFLTIILIGNILLYNLFLAILMTNFEEKKEKADDLREIANHEKTLQATMNKFQKFTAKTFKSLKKKFKTIMKKIAFENENNLSDNLPEIIQKNKYNRRKAYIEF